LGATAVNTDGETVVTEAEMTGGVTAADGAVVEAVSLEEEVNVAGEIAVDQNDAGNIEDVFVYASYLPLDGSISEPLFFMLGKGGVILAWTGEPTDLVGFQKVKNKGKGLKKPLKVNMYKGKFMLPGILKITFGYRLDDGTTVESQQPMGITIDDSATTETSVDTATTDAEVTDTATTDAEVTDTAATDAEVTDTATTDAEATDTAVSSEAIDTTSETPIETVATP